MMFSPRKILALAALVGVVGLSEGTAQAASAKKKNSDAFLSLLTTSTGSFSAGGATTSTVQAQSTSRSRGGDAGGISADAVTPAQRRYILAEMRFLRVVEQQTLQLLRLQRNLGLITPYDWYIQRTQVLVTYVQKQSNLTAQLAGAIPFSPIV